jgi:hypothetical protein
MIISTPAGCLQVSPQPLLPPVQPPAQPAAAVAPAHEAPVSITAPPADVPAWQQSIPALGMSSGEGSTSVREVLLAARAANGRRRQQFLQDSSTQDTVAGRQQEQLPGSPPSHSSDAQSYASGGTPFAHISISSRGPHGKPDEEGSWMGAGAGEHSSSFACLDCSCCSSVGPTVHQQECMP